MIAAAGVQEINAGWSTNNEAEYRLIFVSAEDGRGWMLSCGSYAGPPVYGAGVYYFVRGVGRFRESTAEVQERMVWDPKWPDVALYETEDSVTGEWVYAMMNGIALPKPFDAANIWRAPLANFAEVWREAERDPVCAARSQAYRRELALRKGYPSEVLENHWGLGDDTDTLIYKRIAYKGGGNRPDMINLRLSCYGGIYIEAAFTDLFGVEDEDDSWENDRTHTYESQGWGNGDESVAHALLHDEPVAGVPASELGRKGLVKLWPYFLARCPGAKAAYGAFARSSQKELPD